MTTDNPYDPPKAAVRDPDPGRLLPERPRQIVQAAGLFWLSTTLGIVAAYSEAQRSPGSLAALGVVVLLILALTIVMTVAIWKGRNWARILYVVLVALSFTSFLASWGVVERPGVEVALEAVSFVADCGSFFLLFTRPGSLWFQDALPRQA